MKGGSEIEERNDHPCHHELPLLDSYYGIKCHTHTQLHSFFLYSQQPFEVGIITLILLKS